MPRDVRKTAWKDANRECSYAATSPRMSELPEAGRGKEAAFPYRFQKEQGPADTLI